MKLFFIFLIFLIYLGHTAADLYPQNEGTRDVHRKMDTLKALGLRKTGKVRHAKPTGIPLPAFPWPYVGDGCCHLSTTPKCLKEGGECIPRNYTCVGDVYLGSKYCDFNELASCKCCVPPNCETLNLCNILNGTCNVTCEGRSVSGRDFCKDSKHCKCCLPEEPQDCPCGQDNNGGCKGQFLPGIWATGHCEKNCSKDTYPLEDHTCNKTGGEDCKCCSSLTATTTATNTTTETIFTTFNYCDSRRTTICPDRSKCHEKATCIPNGSGYACKCEFGYAGDGYDCGNDEDLDKWPDVALTCCLDQKVCQADNCPNNPNSGQEDSDYDGIGDACDTVINIHTGDPISTTTPMPDDGFCKPIKTDTKCLNTSDTWKTKDSDGDGHKDSCDNCPNVANVNQTDFDGDGVGDACDTDKDSDNDGFQDGVDNCIDVVNPDQSDADEDGLGDKCDDDADNDGILNIVDNCWLVHNPGQDDADKDGYGDVCQDDKDGDCAPDGLSDICFENPMINNVDFKTFHKVSLDTGTGYQPQPLFTIHDGGKEITQELNSKPGLMYGKHSFTGVDFDGTFFIGTTYDCDYAGFVFGYKSAKSFYVVMWKACDANYWEGDRSRALAGLQLKKVHSITGPNEYLADALWATKNTADQVTLLWHDSKKTPWRKNTPYNWQLIHRPEIGLIRFRFRTKTEIIADSGNIYDSDIQGGRLGVFCLSQEKITWSNLDYKCNENSVPQEVYDALPLDKRTNITVDLSKSWS